MEKQILLPSENCLSATQLSRYLKDECSQKEHRGIDSHLDQCAFCSDAVQGAITLPLSEFENMMNRESILQEISKKTLWLANPTTKIWVGVSAAASIAAIVLLTNTFFGNKPTQQTTVGNTSVPVQAIEAQTSTIASTITENQLDSKVATEKVAAEKPVDNQAPTTEVAAQNTQVTTTGSFTSAEVSTPNVAQPQAEVAQKNVAVAEEKTETYAKRKTAEALPSPVMNSNVQVPNNTQMSTNYDASAKSDNDDVDNGDDSNSKSYNIGMQMYYAKRYQEAIKTLEKFSGEKGTKSEKQKAAWFLANAHLSVGNTPRAKQLLENIVSGGGTYSNNAKATLEKIQ